RADASPAMPAAIEMARRFRSKVDPMAHAEMFRAVSLFDRAQNNLEKKNKPPTWTATQSSRAAHRRNAAQIRNPAAVPCATNRTTCPTPECNGCSREDSAAPQFEVGG